MPRFEITMSDDEIAAYRAAANERYLPLATWARDTLTSAVKDRLPAAMAAKQPAKPRGRPGKTVEDMIARFTSREHPAFPDGTPRMNAIMSDEQYTKRFQDNRQAHLAAIEDVRTVFANGYKKVSQIAYPAQALTRFAIAHGGDGARPLDNGLWRMEPSGEIVSTEEKNRRLGPQAED